MKPMTSFAQFGVNLSEQMIYFTNSAQIKAVTCFVGRVLINCRVYNFVGELAYVSNEMEILE